jgi:hypothetical protein
VYVVQRMDTVTRGRLAGTLSVVLVSFGCREDPRPPTVTPPQPPPAACAAPVANITPDAAPETDPGDDDPFAVDPENRQKPDLHSERLDDRARHLLDAIATGEAARGDDFFFPRSPFIPLKDVRDPGRYFDQLLGAYHRDIRELHKSRRDWTSVRLVSFALGTTPTWVAPGREYNKIGYYRTFGAKLRWQAGDSSGAIGISTIISYHGRWFITHLAPIHH